MPYSTESHELLRGRDTLGVWDLISNQAWWKQWQRSQAPCSYLEVPHEPCGILNHGQDLNKGCLLFIRVIVACGTLVSLGILGAVSIGILVRGVA